MRCIILVLVSAVPVGAVEPLTILRNGTVHDGTGKPGRKVDLVLRGERIVAIGDIKPPADAVVIDCKGLIVAPGFIDLHTHSDYPLQDPATRGNLNYLFQGVTTVVTGNCGSGPVDVAAYFKTLRDHGVGSNVVHLLPHNSLRTKVMGNVDRAPTAAELEKMLDLVERGMRDGAFGMATGLIYNPGTYSKTDELIALAKVVSRQRGLYASHIRNEGVGVLAATEEALTIGREAKLPVHISHMKASGRSVWGKAGDQIAMVLKARKAGQIVTADQYPYVASSTSLFATLVPAQYREGSREDFVARLDDKDQGPRLRNAVAEILKEHRDGATLRIASFRPRTDWQGKSLDVIAREEKKTVLEIVVEIERKGGAGIVNFGMSEEDVRLIMKQDFTATASDGAAKVPGDDVPHPRSYGTFPRKIGHYAIEDGVVSLEHALRSASGLPADILRLKDRGYLRKDHFADIVVFDPKTFRDRATYDRPHVYATGVVHLFVNGTHVIREGRHAGTNAGRPLTPREGMPE